MGLEQLKLSKSLFNSMQGLGLVQAKDVQLKTISRIVGGQSFVVVAPSNSGKTTSYILGILMRLKYSLDEAPKALILVKDQERGEAVIQRFKELAGNRGLRITGLFGTGGMEAEIAELMEGIDVVVATPARARAVYLKLALNVNKLQTFVIDDADEQIAAGQQLPIHELARSAGRCQYLVYTSVYTRKLSEQLDLFLDDPTFIEITEASENKLEIQEVEFFEVPNFQTKLNLLQHTLTEEALANKFVVFVETKITARNVYKELHRFNPLIFQPIDVSQNGVEHVLDFMENEEAKILVVAHESKPELALSFLPSMIHLEVTGDHNVFASLLAKDNVKRLNQVYVSDSELLSIKRLEQTIGAPLVYKELPAHLAATKSKKKNNLTEAIEDAAFHKKKDTNSKSFNYGIGDKIKMNKKKKYG